jgi:hypothetical protein
MISSLEKVDAFLSYQIDDAVFLSEPSRPGPGIEVFEWLWLSNAAAWFSENRLDQFQHSQSRFAICLYPILQVFLELRVENGVSRFTLRQDPPRVSNAPAKYECPCWPVRVEGP